MAALLAPTSPANHLFALAIDNFLADVRQKDAKGPFFDAISTLQESSAQETSQQRAQELIDYVREVAAQRKQGNAIKILTKIEPFVRSLTALARCCEGLLQASPLAVGIVFAGARVMLGAALKLTEGFEVILEAVGEIETYLRCYQLFFEAHQASQDLKQNLITAYINILQFWREASKCLSRNIFKTLAQEIVRPIDARIKECLRAISADRTRIQCLVQATESKLNFQIRVDRQRDCIVAWIRAGEDYSKLIARDELEDRLEAHTSGTCAWIWDSAGFLEWSKTKKSSILWHNAPPGCGKTMLASHVADTLRTRGEQVIWYFCSFNDPIRKHPINVFRSIALQLVKMTEVLPDRLISIFKEEVANEEAFLNYPRTLEKVIHELLNITPKIHIIIDGLDECLPADATPLLDLITRLVSAAPKRHGITKWIFTSRKEGPILKTMSGLGAIEVSPTEEDRMADIKAYLHQRLDGYNTSTYSVDRLAKDSELNFLVAKFKADTVLRLGLTTDAEVEEEMEGFPSGLTGCYLRSLESLQMRSAREQELARRTLLILIGVFQPLTLNELLDALAVKGDSSDYSASHIPRRELIQDLCGSFISFTDSQDGKTNPVIKLGYKSVQDLFFSDPDKLEVPQHLRKYFADEDESNREMGRICLTYLKFKRYGDIKSLPDDFETNPEHAFLRYAAVFWFTHLDYSGKPTYELRQEVREFIRSPAFWTCVRVQGRVAPYLFARYVNKPGECGYSPTARGFAWNQNDSIGWVFPYWLGDKEDCDDCRSMLRGFHSFAVEWYQALSSGRDALRQLPMHPAHAENFPGRSKLLDKSIKRMPIGKDLKAMGATRLSVSEAFVAKGVLKVRLFQSQQWRVSAAFSKVEDTVGTLPPLFPSEMQHLDHLDQGAITSSTGTIAIGLMTLAVKVMTAEGPVMTYPAPNKLAETGSPGPGRHSWQVVSTTRSAGPQGSRAVAYQLIRVTEVGKKTQGTAHSSTAASSSKHIHDKRSDDSSDSDSDEFDEEEEASETEEDHDAESEGVNSGTDTDESANESDPDLEIITSVSIVVGETSKPVWIMDQGAQGAQITGCFHPTEPLYAWTSQSHGLCILNLADGNTKRVVLPEPLEPPPMSPSKPLVTILREVKFSPDGQVLHLLIVRAEPTGLCLANLVTSLSSFPTSGPLNPGPCSKTRTVSFQRGVSLSSLPIPSALTHWSDDAAYICPNLTTCNVKLLRFPLSPPDGSTTNPTPEIQTLTRPIFIPSGTAEQNPHLIYHTSPSKPDDSLYLVLDTDSTAATAPSVIRWSVPRAGGWRAWDPDADATPELAGRPREDEYQALRGSFVATDRSLSVQIRGALDLNRRGFLSCS
ncbi:hypothetical protein QBC39DRAFT_36840 [Podospora conica]|nr:hypothetical protein QBC39DRAFT_36840 [Schizothecium conicum]